GLGGNDTLEGGPGDDSLDGGSGDDTYVEVPGSSDHLFDADGSDTLDFSKTGSGITIDLSQNAGQSQEVVPGGFVFLSGNFENVVGSPFDDVIKGNAGDNRITGGGGNDILSGQGGADTYFFAGTGLGSDTITDLHPGNADTLNFLALGGPVTLDLTLPANATQVVSPGILTLTLADPLAIVNVVGSAYDDHITGNAAANILIGGGGDDVLAGKGGNDLLEGGLTQVVYLDFDASTDLTRHYYTPRERADIQQRLQAAYSRFSFLFTQSLETALQ